MSDNPLPGPHAPKFSLGQVVITRHALGVLQAEDVFAALARHAAGDWGDVDRHDASANEHALADGFRILSAYQDRDGTKFWIITEADRRSTCVLLPEDY